MRDTIDMAREAGIDLDLIDEDEGLIWYITTEGMKAFEALVRADERKAIAELFPYEHMEYFGEEIQEAIRARGNT